VKRRLIACRELFKRFSQEGRGLRISGQKKRTDILKEGERAVGRREDRADKREVMGGINWLQTEKNRL